jgi:hypothetical protein
VNETQRFESLESLRKAAYESFDSRRSYEWKLSLAIWAAEGLALVALLQPEKDKEVFPLKAPWGWIGALCAGVLLVLLHYFLSLGFKSQNERDRVESLRFKKQMERMVRPPYRRRVAQDKAADADADGWWLLGGWWSHVGQIGITLLLAATAVLIIWLRSH